ncbi:hypothetical protein [Acinetobacter sp.]|uniref:hypothetical protein n=1 Tax=Acinetobacter sp. TaxID=472 RepID=UPI002FC913D3
MFEGTPKFLGTLIQRFNIRNGKAAKPYRDNIEEIKSQISNHFFQALAPHDMVLDKDIYSFKNNGFCLAEIPDFQGLLPKSYNAQVPVFKIEDQEIGEVGSVLESMKQKRDGLLITFNAMKDEILRLIDHV